MNRTTFDDTIYARRRESDKGIAVSNTSLNMLTAEEFVPDWTQHRFVVLDPTGRWSSAIAAQVKCRLSETDGRNSCNPVFESCRTARETLLLSEARNTIGVVLLIAGIERECLNLLAKIARWPKRPSLLAFCSSEHEILLPMLLESGLDATMFDVEDDILIADWCVRVLSRHFQTN